MNVKANKGIQKKNKRLQLKDLCTIQTTSFSSEDQDARLVLEGLRQTIQYFKLKDLQEQQYTYTTCRQRESINDRDLFIIQEELEHQDDMWRNWHTHTIKHQYSSNHAANTQSIKSQPQHHQIGFFNASTHSWKYDSQGNSNIDIQLQIPQHNRRTKYQSVRFKRDIQFITLQILSICDEKFTEKFWFDSSKKQIFSVSQLNRRKSDILYKCSEVQLRNTLIKLRKKGIYIDLPQQENKKIKKYNSIRKGISLLTEKRKH